MNFWRNCRLNILHNSNVRPTTSNPLLNQEPSKDLYQPEYISSWGLVENSLTDTFQEPI